MTMLLEIMEFIFSDFFVWLGSFLIIKCICKIFHGLVCIDKSTHIHIGDEELSEEDTEKIIKRLEKWSGIGEK